MISIRNARQHEVSALADIGMLAWEQAVLGVADLDALRENARNAFAAFLSRHWSTVIAAELDGVLAGWAAREAMDEEITDLWVAPQAQRQGIGSALLSAVEAEMVEASHEAAGLQTHARNALALSFFRKHGYSVSWLSVAYSPKLDRDVESIGLRRNLVEDEPLGYGSNGF
ncbi:N-acetyltransferase [Sinorhizobium sp. BG8]|uniref:GNAT family N-acetyltransferase n=1 Tax=Sinorhizobium sp. BG8 TaxID=2613773 RepID=UPI00193DE7ED|nr:N-acetyltransferase [Sinorhizobium sp. BG8]QRM55050.1 GNAT family N-acetyltransferase [Sinorhizobium sp. BG8]